MQQQNILKDKRIPPKPFGIFSTIGACPLWSPSLKTGKLTKFRLGWFWLSFSLYKSNKGRDVRAINIHYSKDLKTPFPLKPRAVVSASALSKLLKDYLSFGGIKVFNLQKYKNKFHEHPHTVEKLRKYNVQFKYNPIKSRTLPIEHGYE